ncbi:PH domain-containing protein [Salinigranum halophilum]|uniref:PH domain-containing protein n=1 Tax=Salinigranum halophilum TaxID=2565931 RepID=UPI00115E8424|nr:PH domain-containing protein [Salinigranum halophilum]
MNRLHPRVRLVWVARAVVSATVLGVVLGVAARIVPFVPTDVVALAGVVLLFGVVHAVLRYRSWRYEIRDDSIYLERGVLTRVRTVVPFVRIQHVDSSRSPVERAVGLGRVVVYTAGSRGADVSVPGLTPVAADDLRERLKRLAIRAEGDDAV